MDITWTAGNHHTFLNGHIPAKTIKGAVIAARRYLRQECAQDMGTLTIYVDDIPVRTDRCDVFTSYRWCTQLL